MAADGRSHDVLATLCCCSVSGAAVAGDPVFAIRGWELERFELTCAISYTLGFWREWPTPTVT